jgi:hypothetical protein
VLRSLYRVTVVPVEHFYGIFDASLYRIAFEVGDRLYAKNGLLYGNNQEVAVGLNGPPFRCVSRNFCQVKHALVLEL